MAWTYCHTCDFLFPDFVVKPTGCEQECDLHVLTDREVTVARELHDGGYRAHMWNVVRPVRQSRSGA